MRLSESDLIGAAREVLVGLGESADNATLAAELFVQADLRGVSTHGVNLLRLVSQRVEAKLLDLPTTCSIESDSAAAAVLNGNNGLGQIAASMALDIACDKAGRFGIAMATLKNTNNIGALGCLSLKATRRGYIALIMTNGNPSVAPYGAARPFFGTNPLSIAVPRGNAGPLVLDMSSSIVARGKIRLASMSGQEIPLGWALDDAGLPTTDPKKALKGCLLPLAGPKGSGLAMMIDILSGLLAGAAYGDKLKSFHELEGPTGVGAVFICIDIGFFMDKEKFTSLLMDYSERMKGLARQPGFDEILLPGELETKKEAESHQSGIEVPDVVVDNINDLLKKLNSTSRLQAREW